MLSVEEAQKKIFAEIHPMEKETIALPLSLDRILAEEILSTLDLPPWDTSAMDGYAVCSTDTKGASRITPCRLNVIEVIPAGTMPSKKVLPGMASKIMTGAPMPEGADAVVKVEDTEQGAEGVHIYAEANLNFVRHRGEVVRVGDLVLKKGIKIRSFEIAMIASLGRSQVSVFQRPRVAILSTGNELVDIHQLKTLNQIYNSNGYGLAAQIIEAGGIPIPLGIAKDNRTDLIAKLKGASDADFILLSGGVSVGDYDFVKEVFSEDSGKVQFWKVAMKPGKPFAFGMLYGKPTFGLPGNPVSAMVTFDQLVRPALLYAQGSVNLFRPVLYAKLIGDIQKEPGRRHFIRGRLTIKGSEYYVVPTGDQDSANLISLVKANAFIVLPEEGEGAKAGSRVLVQMLPASLV